ncbi:MAG TPA: tetratricopeptide repeat protein [Terriglobia bacterium]|nr:tetratricopeptide repeat protein [Terriglobia bacterium]
MSEKKKNRPAAKGALKYWHLAVIAGVCIAVFANSLSGSFVWDDEIQVVKNWRIRSFENLPSAFTSAFWSFLGTEAESQTNFYRPVQTITYTLAYSIGELSPVAYHVLNLAYHVLASLFVYLICIELMLAPPIALGIAALFAAHPVHTEAVAWIAGVPDVACGAFYFGAVWFFLKYLRERRAVLLGAACFMFFSALLAKEMAVTLPIFLLLLLIMRDRSRIQVKANLWLVSPFFAVLGAYIVLRVSALGLLARSHIDVQASGMDWISLGVRVVAEYIRYAILPYPLNAFHLLPVKLDYRLISTSLSLAVILILIASLWSLRARIPDALLWFCSFLLMLVPVLYFKGMSNTFLAERYLYIPSFAMIMVLVSVASGFKVPRLNVILGSIAVVFAIASVYRNETWKTSEGLYQTTLRVQPEVVHMRINLADIHMKRSEDAIAQSLLESSVRYMDSDLYVRFPFELYRAYVGLGAIAARAGKFAEAKQDFEKAIGIHPRGDWGYLYLGGVFMEANGDYARAVEYFKKAIELGPLNEVARDYLGIAMLNQKNYKDAVRYFEEALKINPNYADARSHLALASRALAP